MQKKEKKKNKTLGAREGSFQEEHGSGVPVIFAGSIGTTKMLPVHPLKSRASFVGDTRSMDDYI